MYDDMTEVLVDTVDLLPGSTIGYGEGTLLHDETRRVGFHGDWRPMADLQRAMRAGAEAIALVPFADTFPVLPLSPEMPGPGYTAQTRPRPAA